MWANNARSKLIRERGEEFDNPCCETTLLVREMNAPGAHAGSGEAENFGRGNGTAKRKQFVSDRVRSGELHHPRLIRRSRYHP
jgi:hypothetical protein